MSLAIKVEDLSKRYRLGVINRDMLYKGLKNWGPVPRRLVNLGFDCYRSLI